MLDTRLNSWYCLAPAALQRNSATQLVASANCASCDQLRPPPPLPLFSRQLRTSGGSSATTSCISRPTDTPSSLSAAMSSARVGPVLTIAKKTHDSP